MGLIRPQECILDDLELPSVGWCGVANRCQPKDRLELPSAEREREREARR